MNRVGDVHTLPRENHPDADEKPGRPWLLVHTPPEAAPIWTFAYGTRQPTEEVEGATPLMLEWMRLSGRRTTSRFFPIRLRAETPDRIPERMGHARGARPEIRDALRQALGVGTPPGRGPVGKTFERGQVVSLASMTREAIGARYAVLVTAPAYAAVRRYQLLLPLYDRRDVEPRPGELVVQAKWLEQLPRRMDEGLVAIPSLFSGCEHGQPRTPGEIVGLAPARADTATLRQIDQSLTDYFGL